ncbi:MAG: chorismate mutase [Alphaproteobacteria bacterium]
MSAVAVDLAELRAQIDRIDSELHALIKRRAQVVVEVGRTKAAQKGVVLRPGREARILRRLLAEHDGPFPARALLAIWREIVSAAVNMQGKFSIAVPRAAPQLVQLARDHFGVISPVAPAASDRAALAAVASGKAPIALVSATADWWRRKLPDGLHVVLALPAVADGAGAPAAFVVARSAPEESGDDWTLVRLEATGALTPAVLRKALGRGRVRVLARAKAGRRTQVLAAIPGFRDPANWGISAPGPNGPGNGNRGDLRGTYLGAFHSPIVVRPPRR